MDLKKTASLLVLCATAAGAGPGDAQEQARERFVCNFGAAQRLIDIYRLDTPGDRPGACRVDYTRDGVTRQVWSAHGNYAYCVKQAVALVTKLTKGNFSCKPQSARSPTDQDSGAR